MNAIAVGYTGKLDMLKAIYGGGEEDHPPEQLPELTQGGFAAMMQR